MEAAAETFKIEDDPLTKVCLVCLSTRNVDYPPPQNVWLGLQPATGYKWQDAAPGLCRWCRPIVRKAEMMVERAHQSMEILRQLSLSEALNIEKISHVTQDTLPLARLSRAHRAPHQFDYEFQCKQMVFSLEDEPEMEILIKEEVAAEWDALAPKLTNLGVPDETPTNLGAPVNTQTEIGAPTATPNNFLSIEMPDGSGSDVDIDNIKQVLDSIPVRNKNVPEVVKKNIKTEKVTRKRKLDAPIETPEDKPIEFGVPEDTPIELGVPEDMLGTPEELSLKEMSHDSDSDMDSDYYFESDPVSPKRKKSTTTKKMTKLTETKNKEKLPRQRDRRKNKDEPKKPPLEHDDNLKKWYDIKLLSEDEQREDVLKRARSTGYAKALWKCNKCFKWFNCKPTHEAHMLMHTVKHGRYRCVTCLLHFENRIKINSHFNNNHKYRITCKTCRRVVRTRGQALAHIEWHEGLRHICETCGMEFQYRSILANHKRIKHPSSQHVCNLCGYEFQNKKGLERHKRLKHFLHDDSVPISGPRCEQCDITFLNAAALAAHTRVSPRHGECKNNDAAVLKLKQKVEPFACDKCGMQMSDDKMYVKHYAKFHPGDAAPHHYQCHQCGKYLKNKNCLQNHAMVHVVEKNYECDICQRKFKGKEHLGRHIVNMHTNKVVAPCKVCGKTLSAGNMPRHLKTHGPKAYECNMCERAFATKPEREIHVRHVHLKLPYPKRNRKKAATRGFKDD